MKTVMQGDVKEGIVLLNVIYTVALGAQVGVQDTHALIGGIEFSAHMGVLDSHALKGIGKVLKRCWKDGCTCGRPGLSCTERCQKG